MGQRGSRNRQRKRETKEELTIGRLTSFTIALGEFSQTGGFVLGCSFLQTYGLAPVETHTHTFPFWVTYGSGERDRDKEHRTLEIKLITEFIVEPGSLSLSPNANPMTSLDPNPSAIRVTASSHRITSELYRTSATAAASANTTALRRPSNASSNRHIPYG